MTSKTCLRARRALVGLTLGAVVGGLAPNAVSAHPLGNFSVNRLHTLTVSADKIVDELVIDMAEIPTTQLGGSLDVDNDGLVDSAERTAHASQTCDAVVDELSLVVDGMATALEVVTASFVFAPGQAGLDTSRLECRFEAPIAFEDTNAQITFDDNERSGRVGWNEINALGNGVAIVDSPVPKISVTNGLTEYPVDLLASPLDVRSVQLLIEPTTASKFSIDPLGVDDTGDTNGAASARNDLVAARPGFFDGTVGRVQDAFDDVLGRSNLTVEVGLLAMALAVVLGASHAMLPGHGKTVMAAYIAGRQGSTRDAVVVGATVTATHTGGVLLLGLALTVSSSLAGESILGWLGVASGLLIAALGLGLLVSAVRHRENGFFGHGHSHGPHGHSHGPDGHSHHHDDHSHHDDHDDHDHGAQGHRHHGHKSDEHGNHDHEGDPHQRHGHESYGRGVSAAAPPESGRVAVLDPVDLDEHVSEHEHQHHIDAAPKVSRRGLVGMGIAGGLVPSPSALIILLSAIALGRTWFGILLVFGYGLGMACTLTLAGVFLVKVRDRLQGRLGSQGGRLATFGRKWASAMPYLTAALVFVVGFGLAIRGLADV